jgi:hypothetical protein
MEMERWEDRVLRRRRRRRKRRKPRLRNARERFGRMGDDGHGQIVDGEYKSDESICTSLALLQQAQHMVYEQQGFIGNTLA